MISYDEAKSNLGKLINWFEHHKDDRNESDTRFHLIDKILLEVLNWQPEDINTETHHNGTFTDYILSSPIPLAIIEAKKEGIYFELPVGNKQITRNLKPLCNDNDEIKKAVQQVASYCQERGIEIAIVTNGWQFIVFIANRTDGIPPLEGKAFVFDSLDYINDNFREFWNVCSKDGVTEKYLQKQLSESEFEKLPPKNSQTLDRYPGLKNRNPLQTDMQILSDLVLEDVIKEEEVEEEFLKRCYSKSGALSQYSLVSKQILRTRYKFLFEDKESNLSIDKAVKKKGISKDLVEVISNSLSRRPILLVGDVGVGKSTFISNLVKVDGKSIFRKTIALRIDLGSRAILNKDLRDALVEEIVRILKEENDTDIHEDGFVRGTYHSKLQAFKKGVNKRLYDVNPGLALEKEIDFLEKLQNDKINHVKYSLEHISKAWEKQIVVFIDNCDQRSDSVQQDAFLIAQEIAEDWPALVFLALRPETFHRSLRSGALSGYHPKAFTISPPRIDEVITKRLDFAKDITSGEIPIRQINITTNLSRLDTMLEVLSFSLKRNPTLISFIDNISNGNVRIAIDYVKQFLGSGHVDTKKILDIVEDQGSYLIPLHEFLRAVIFGDNFYYDPNTSSVVNLFDVSHNDKKEHFLLSILLSILQQKAKDGKSEGFIEINRIYENIQKLGFNASQIDSVLTFSYKKKLIESSRKGDIHQTDQLPSLIRITTLGAYHIDFLISNYAYFDAMCVDIPIFNDNVFEELNSFNEFNIEERLDRAELVLDYLNNIWNEIDLKTEILNWPHESAKLKENINKVRGKVENKNKS
ncbi:hypothetical protein [Gracilimonas amylolytica]|uniref:hypothetical protein n=1 Tax=Gracilimonas amylolytica TaxID=1749045 RepID=UPI000CD9275F|nr:hypothetical protein [Gracilimonas amylolytica]